MITFIKKNKNNLIRWVVVGVFLLFINSILLFIFVDIVGLTVPLGTLLTAELTTLLRFLMNSFWVFRVQKITFHECIQFHIANSGTFFIWWSTANLLNYFNVNYLIAGILAVFCSTFFSLYTNFFWIWRKKTSH